MSSFLLDTNAIIAYIKGDEKLNLVLANADELYIPVTAVAEAFYGAEKSAKVEENKANIESVIRVITVLNNDVLTARVYGKIINQLRAKGRPIPQNDVWIASIVIQYDLILITRDKHFNNVDAVVVRSW